MDGMFDNGTGFGGMDSAGQFDAGGGFGVPFPQMTGGLDGMFVPKPQNEEPNFHVTPIDEVNGGQAESIGDGGSSSPLEQYMNLWKQPMGVDDDGVPVYRHMPFDPSKIEGEFIAPIEHVYATGRSLEWKKIPAAGEDRDAVLEEIAQQRQSEEAQMNLIQQVERESWQRRGELAREGFAEAEIAQKEQKLRDEMHELELARVNDMSPEEYRTTRDMGLVRLDPTTHNGMYKDFYDNIYRVDADGSVTKIVVV